MIAIRKTSLACLKGDWYVAVQLCPAWSSRGGRSHVKVATSERGSLEAASLSSVCAASSSEAIQATQRSVQERKLDGGCSKMLKVARASVMVAS